jgi:hypothetical protein
LALDLPVAVAGGPQTNEAGMLIWLNGSASTAPSGLPLSFNWTQLTGPPVTLLNSNTALASFAAAANVGALTDLTFLLTVHDTRFDSNAVAAVTLYPLVDSDGDGLSDQEELTGVDNLLTLPNPAGNTTNPNVADTDGDGQSDGAEALAGTNPNDAGSVLRVREAAALPGGFRLDWPTVPGKTYVVEYVHELGSTWSNLTTISATTAQTNVTDGSAVGQPKRFYRVRLTP